MSAARILIRRALPADAAAIADIYNQAIHSTTATFDTEPKPVSERLEWLQEHDERHPVLVAELDGQVVGWGALTKWSDRPAYSQAAESSFYVGEPYRGRGIGRALKECLIEEARRLGYHTLLARVAEGSAASLHLNESCGFRHVGTMKQVGLKFGRKLDVHLMQLMLAGVPGAASPGTSPLAAGILQTPQPRESALPQDASSDPAVVLLSGGLDSATALAVAQSEGYDCYALSFDYGQRHRYELEAAGRVAARAAVKEHVVIALDLRTFGGSALTSDLDVPKDRSDEDVSTGIPITYVPARNTVFLSLALGWAEVLGAFDIFIGVNAVDYSGYPDCRPEFIEQFERLANLATKAGVEGRGSFTIHTPLIRLTKAEIIRVGLKLGVDYSLTHSCYDPSPDGRPCGRCDSCQLRAKGFAEAGVPDPLDTGCRL